MTEIALGLESAALAERPRLLFVFAVELDQSLGRVDRIGARLHDSWRA